MEEANRKGPASSTPQPDHPKNHAISTPTKAPFASPHPLGFVAVPLLHSNLYLTVLLSSPPFFAFSLQLWVGVMLHTQPFFIAGIEDAGEAKSSAFGAMAMFIVTFISSLLGLWYDSQNKVDETVSSSGAPEAEYHLSTGHVPTYGTSS